MVVGLAKRDLVAGQGGQAGEQAVEAAVGGRPDPGGGLGLGGGGALGRGDGVAPGGRVLVGEGQRRPGPAQVRGQVATSMQIST